VKSNASPHLGGDPSGSFLFFRLERPAELPNGATPSVGYFFATSFSPGMMHFALPRSPFFLQLGGYCPDGLLSSERVFFRSFLCPSFAVLLLSPALQGPSYVFMFLVLVDPTFPFRRTRGPFMAPTAMPCTLSLVLVDSETSSPCKIETLFRSPVFSISHARLFFLRHVFVVFFIWSSASSPPPPRLRARHSVVVFQWMQFPSPTFLSPPRIVQLPDGSPLHNRLLSVDIHTPSAHPMTPPV